MCLLTETRALSAQGEKRALVGNLTMPMGDTWYLDEVFVTIQGRQQYLWRAVDEPVTSWTSSCNRTGIGEQPSDSFGRY